MRRTRCLIVLALAGLLAVAPASAKEDDPPTPNDQAKAFAKDFKNTYKKMPIGDLIAELDKLIEFYKNKDVDDTRVRKDIVTCLTKVALMKDVDVVAHLMKKCGELDGGVVNIVVMVIQKELKKRVADDRIYEPAFETLGKLRSENPKIVKTLTDLLKYKENDVVALAAYALSHYGPASGRVRKDIFKELLNQFEGVYSQSQASNENAKRKWTVAGEDVMRALNQLSVPPRTEGDFANPIRARGWYNQFKKASWAPKPTKPEDK